MSMGGWGFKSKQLAVGLEAVAVAPAELVATQRHSVGLRLLRLADAACVSRV